MAIRSRKTSVKGKSDAVDYKSLDYVTLVDTVRNNLTKDRAKSEFAFNEIERRMQTKIKQISYKFHIPGYEFSDIYNEALSALRFKAIKDYDKDRGNGSGPYPFEKFAVLCIRRHLSTKLKACYQNKKRFWLGLVSLDQDRNDSSDDNLFLVDIVPQTEGTVLEAISKDEFKRNLMRKLYEDLSYFEQKVFMKYLQRRSYEQ